jgi:hypothetical protein
MQIVGLALGDPTEFDGAYVTAYDPNGNRGRGKLEVTREVGQACVFSDAQIAVEVWRRTADPPWHVRLDGQPNRPLTAYTVRLAPAP